jgi:peroxiredoxin
MVLNPSTYSSDFLQVIKKQTRFLMLVFPSMKGKICRREEKKNSTILLPLSTAWIFSLYFQLPYLPEEICSASGILCGGRYQPACHYL